MNVGTMRDLDQFVKDKLPNVHGVLVVRHGYLVFEQYYQGYRSDVEAEIASATKSFTSALIGIALDKKLLQTVDQKLFDFFPEYSSTGMDSRTREITLKHLLTMTAGFEWSEESAWSWPKSGDWMKFVLDLPMSSPPGQKFTYNTPAVHLLSGVLTRATRMNTLDFAVGHLFKPLGISMPQWSTDPQGRNNGGKGLFLKPRDMAKFGYLYLNNGFWDGRQIVPAEWVKVSTQEQSQGGFPENVAYGYLWWVTTVNGNPAYFAAGYGGQYIYVIPHLDVVVVITSDVARAHQENGAIVSKFVVPAILQ